MVTHGGLGGCVTVAADPKHTRAYTHIHMHTHRYQKDSREQQLIVAQHDRAARVAVIARGGRLLPHHLQEVVSHDGRHGGDGRC